MTAGGQVDAAGERDALAVTRASGSNLAAAFFLLPPQRRRDMTTLYAFCRRVDDIGDAADYPGGPAGRRAALARWRQALVAAVEGEDPLAAPVRDLIARRGIDGAILAEIVAGVEMDLERRRYATFEELRGYCYRVASAVGLASIEIFGYDDPVCRRYAVDLGLALQLTNILRDVGEDWRNGQRVYLPEEDLARFDYGIEDLARGVRDDRFFRLMDFQADRAEGYFRSARALLPRPDRGSMVAAEMMGAIYRRLLRHLRRERYPVFDRPLRLGKAERILAALSAAARTLWCR